MIEFSASDRDKLFQSQIPPGTALWFHDYKFPDGTIKDKYIVILNQNHENNSYFLLTTSQIKPLHKSRPKRYLIIKSGCVDFFPKDTAIDTFTIADCPFAKLRKKCIKSNPSVKRVGKLPSYIMDKIYLMIKDSDEISTAKKKIVLK